MSSGVKKQKDKLQFKIKRHFVEVLKSKNSDHSIARGFAMGTFVALLPTPGISTLIGVLMIAIFKKINKVAVFVALAIWNVWTVIPFYWASLELGDFIFKEVPAHHFEVEYFNQIYLYSRRFIVGSLVISIPFSFLCYYFALWFIRKVRSNRDENTVDEPLDEENK